MMYQFENLQKFLDDLDFPKVSGSGWKLIKGIDFEKAFKAGKISFEDDGIYLNYDGEKYRGYMFIKTPYIEAYGSYPRFHLTKCEVIQQFIEDGNFNKRYEWSNSNVNDLIDITTGKLYQNENLSYCSKCKRQLLGEIQTTSDFHEILKNAHQLEEEVEVDLFGYVKGWNRFSRAFRESKNYICDECGISPNEASHKRYWQVHHIDGDKTNNQESNLRCLCIECHSTVDAVHSQNFQSKAQQIELTRFRDLYNPKNP